MTKSALVRPALSTRAPRLYRAFTWSAVFPLGAFLLVHLAVNAAALRGDAAFARAVHGVLRLPVLWLVEAIFVYAPLFAHGGIGLYLAVTRTRLTEKSPYPDGLRIAVRATGVVAAAFIAIHLPELRFRVHGVRLGGGELETLLGAGLSRLWHGGPWGGVVYLVGTTAVAFHFAAGLWGWLMTTRAALRPAVRRWAGWGAGTVGAAIWALLVNIVVFHATGSRLFGEPAETAVGEQGEDQACPAPEAK